jgi:PAS domain S-box-containing protein
MSEAARRILIVEDQRLIAADLESTLKKLGYLVVGNVASGEEAITTSDQVRPELVLMDVRLRGEMDGIHAAEIIRDRFNLPVVFLTAYADEETILRAKKTTPYGYLVKPFNEREMRATIEIAFYTHQMERTLADERARRQGAEEFKILVDGVKDYAIFMVDVHGRVITWNSGAERLKGYTGDEVIGRDFSVFYPEEARQAGHPAQLLETAVRDGRYEEENWRVRKDGTRFWASVIITAIRNESGTLVGFAKVTRDLTERRLAEEQRDAERREAERVLRGSEERFRLLVAEVRDYAIFSLDLEGHVMTWNLGAERIKGYRADEIIGESFTRFYVQEDVNAGVPGRLLRRASEEGVATDEGLRVRKDGSRFWASAVLTALHDTSGRLTGFAKVTRDITEQKHTERRMAILADASRLLGESLDSDQILFTITRMAIPNFADGVVIDVRDSEGEPRLSVFHATNPELLAAVRDLQVRGAYRVAAPSRRVMRTGRSELHPQLTPEWLRGQDMDDELAFLILRFGIRSTVHVPITMAGRPFAVIVRSAHPSATIQLQCPTLHGAWDRDRLEQVFSNLIGNALAHGDPNKPVTVTAGAEALTAWVRVHNEGPPIPHELQSALFNPFRMGERSSRSPAGLGLGLYISNEVIRRHGGQIEVESTAVDGTMFRVVLPREAIGNSGDRGGDP